MTAPRNKGIMGISKATSSSHHGMTPKDPSHPPHNQPNIHRQHQNENTLTAQNTWPVVTPKMEPSTEIPDTR
ncbi:Hypothetical predicted protein [Pelobates cultripes]|uniref:Uncharacterized protein n=1 Tax=Pelobates cultripes TaxID=61616 RepID=A0AAD1W835_PELCU|nr:Hypothetical predicted protein [Pelobates cultripes]